jgi:hypothetical protein
MRAVGAGAAVSYELVNYGNSTEVVDTRVSAPAGGRSASEMAPRVVVNADSAVSRQVALSIPSNVGTGSFFLRLEVLENGAVRSSLPITVEISAMARRQEPRDRI